MSQPRLRVFAGPNGSGKSTLFESFSTKYDTGHFLNSDRIEQVLSTKGYIDLTDYDLYLDQEDLDSFLQTPRAASLIQKANNDNHKIDIAISENLIVDIEKTTHSYEGALVNAFLREHLQKKKIDFCFETVMSHISKIEEIIEIKNNGYKTYLYFICIDDPEVNISRVDNRVHKGGHYVDPNKIESRYYETLNNLINAIETSDKCYFFDNSQDKFILIATIFGGKLTLEIEPVSLPNWFLDYVLKYYE